jgi:hypothetical protein
MSKRDAQSFEAESIEAIFASDRFIEQLRLSGTYEPTSSTDAAFAAALLSWRDDVREESITPPPQVDGPIRPLVQPRRIARRSVAVAGVLLAMSSAMATALDADPFRPVRFLVDIGVTVGERIGNPVSDPSSEEAPTERIGDEEEPGFTGVDENSGDEPWLEENFPFWAPVAPKDTDGPESPSAGDVAEEEEPAADPTAAPTDEAPDEDEGTEEEVPPAEPTEEQPGETPTGSPTEPTDSPTTPTSPTEEPTEPGGEEPGGEEPGGEQPGGEQPGGEQPGTTNGGGPGDGVEEPGDGTGEPGADPPGDTNSEGQLGSEETPESDEGESEEGDSDDQGDSEHGESDEGDFFDESDLGDGEWGDSAREPYEAMAEKYFDELAERYGWPTDTMEKYDEALLNRNGLWHYPRIH